jgi:murein DD-endopeptidase MepM/ murein hydrolase activator NlpD
MSHLLWRASVLVTLIIVTVPSGAVYALPCWLPPVSAPVTDPFREPACAWCSGNRGIEYGTHEGAVVVAAATGRVTYAGNVIGTTYVVVRHGDGRRVTYGNLDGESFDTGDLVVRGQRIGRAAGRLHLGVREGDRYIDPARFIGQFVRPPRLIPADGRRGNEAPPPRLSCQRPKRV